jgi:DNA-directed RNA polymerase subunit RPC12/RpoP
MATWWSSNNQKSPHQVFRNTTQKYEFDCQICRHQFEMAIASTSSERFCPYCSHRKLCEQADCTPCCQASMASYSGPQTWSSENTVSARNVFKGTVKLYIFNCNSCHNDFDAAPNHITNLKEPRGCPHCVYKGEGKLYEWLLKRYANFSKQRSFEWTKTQKSYRKYDFCINELEILIELGNYLH